MNDQHGGSVLQQQGLKVSKSYNTIDDRICQFDCLLCNDPSLFEDDYDDYNDSSKKTIKDVYDDLLKNNNDIEQVYANLRAWCKKENTSDTWIRKHLEIDSRCTEKYRTSIEHYKVVGEYDETIKE